MWLRGTLPDSFTVLLTGRTPGLVPGAGGSFGTLCLGGAIGRFGGMGLRTGRSGELSQSLDLSALATPNGVISVQPGDTWYFQAWFRDMQGGVGSNFSSAIAVTFQP